MDLFDYQPPQRYPDAPGSTNDTTSREAAEAMAPCAKSLRAAALAAITAEGIGGLTTNELATAMKCARDSVQPRTSELKAEGKIVDIGLRRYNANGKKAIVWIAAQFQPKETTP